MSQNICNICGANYEYRNGRWVCPACGAYKAEELSNEEVTLLYNAAQKLRLSDFDEAEKAYADIIAKYPHNSEGYWGRLLARFGIKYEEDFDGKQIPTCYATIESIMSDKDYTKAVALADEDTKAYYIKQAEYIERVRKEWVEKARKEKPYDIFISYKDSDAQNGIERTKDSIAAQDLYIHLTGKGYRVFFSRESLRDKVGEKYEPYIFNALSTAKVMIVYGSSSEYITSTWVKNEWMRYENKVQAGAKKQNSLIVACDGFSPSELPKALSSMQCLDATKRSFYEDLDKAIDKIIKVEEKPKEQIVEEKKKVKKLPIAIAACAVFVAVLLCILIPNLTNQEITNLTNSYYGISVDADRDVFPKGTELTVEEILSGEKYDMVQAAIGEVSESFKAYDIELTGKKNIDINGTVTVKIPLPNDMSATGISAYYISDKGVAEKLECSVADGYVTFKTTHFSIYVIAEDKINNTGFEYKINDNDTVTLNKYTGSETTVVIPQTIEGKTVTEIGSLAFDSMDRITSVSIPETVTTIGAKAFYGCTSISTITIPETVTSIGTSAFYGWSSSQEIILAGRKAIPSGWNAQWNGSCNAKLTYGVIAIIYHSNGGSGTMSNQEVEINSSVLVSENKFNLAGYTFAGWATSENGEVVILDKGSYSVAKESVYHLYAVWSANENKVVFNANGGSGEMQAQKICTDDKENLSECLFTKDGYAFGGWATTSNGSVVYSDGGLYTMGTDAEYTLYAIWIPNNNALIFNSNGGFGSMDSITVETNETINLPKNVFTLDGYTFLGWSDVQNGVEKYTDEQSFTMSSSATITLYAVWRANENELTFNSNDGTNSERSINMDTGASANLPANTFTREGYTFLGWSTTANGVVEYADGVNYTMGAASTTLYAVWSANDNRIIFNSNGGSGTMDAQIIKTDASANLTNCGFERNGYIFAGWATTPTGNVVYTNEASYTMGANSEYTLYAIWTTADYSVTYVLNGGTNSGSNPAGFDITDSTITLAEPTRAGYTFNGWFSDENFQNASNTIPSGSTGNKTFYASWSANENTLHFNENGGSGSIADMKIKTDASATLTKNTLTREGYTFAGWATIANGSVEYEDEATYTMGSNSEYTLYAVWEIISYTITYNTNGGTISGNRTSYNAETETFTLPKPTKFGYTFLGWSGADITGKQETVTISKGSVGDKEFTANWKANDYTITLNVNGGNALDDNTIDVIFDQNFTLPTPEYKGYEFKGWYYNNTVLVEAGKYDDYDKSIELKAKWEIINYELSYDTDGGTLSGQKTEYNVTTNTFTLPQPTKTGYRFLGWSGTDVDGIQLTVTVSKGNIGARSYIAHWEANTYTVTYDPNEGSVTPTTDEVVFDTELTLPTPTRAGYHFDGWLLDGSAYTAELWKIAENKTLVAKWTANTNTAYTVKHYLENANDDGYTLQDTQTLYGTTDTTVSPNTKTYTGFNAPSKTSVKILGDGTAVLEYRYTRTTRTVTFITNGGNVIDTMTVKYQQTVNMPDAEREGFTFGGWFKDAALSNQFTQTTVSSNLTLYAWWEEESKPGVLTYSGTSAITINGYEGEDTYLGIPAYIGGVPITTIASNAFVNENTLTEVRVPTTVTQIGAGAFQGCNSIEKMVIPFVGRSRSTINYQPESNYTWSGGSYYLFGYIFGGKNEKYSSSTLKPSNGENIVYQGEAYDGYSSYYYYSVYYIPSSIREVVITDATGISGYAFYGCSMITNVTINSDTTFIGTNAFYNCENITQFDMKNSIVTIGASAFANCKELVKITNASKVTSLGEYAFSNCSKLSGFNGESIISLPNTLQTIGKSAFANCVAISDLVIPNSVTSIGDTAFYSCSSITKVNSTEQGKMLLYEGLDSIGEKAFYCLNQITEIEIPKSVTTIKAGAFQGCNALEKIALPFVGRTRSTINYQTESDYSWSGGSYYLFGYIFGGYYERYNSSTLMPSNGENLVYQGEARDTYSSYYYYNVYYIPSTLREVNITDATGISAYAFYGCNMLTKVNINDSVTLLGKYAFYNCEKLLSLNSTNDNEFIMPTGITSIEEGTFYNCDELMALDMSNVITYIGSSAFKNCNKLQEVQRTGDLTRIGASAFEGCNQLLCFNSSGIELSATLIEIGEKAFANCSSITEVTIPASVKTIGNNAFASCSAIIKVNSTSEGSLILLEGLESIGEKAFYGLNQITEITLPKSVTLIEAAVFQGCNSLEKITLPFVGRTRSTINYQTESDYSWSGGSSYLFGYIFGGTTEKYSSVYSKPVSTAAWTYQGEASDYYSSYYYYNGYYIPSSLQEVVVTDATGISAYAFYGCTMLTKLSLNNEITMIGTYAFYNCKNIYSFNGASDGEFSLPSSLNTIGGFAFYNCDGIVIVDMNDSVTSIGASAFADCNEITKVQNANNVENLSDNAFYGCNKLIGFNNSSSVVIPSKVTSIGSGAFNGCSLITNVTIHSDVKTIGDNAFCSCSSITKVNSSTEGKLVLLDGVEVIGEKAFCGLAQITEIIVPTSVTQIGAGAFQGCNALEKITLPFVGRSRNTINYQPESDRSWSGGSSYLFGYIFGGTTQSYSSVYSKPTSTSSWIYQGEVSDYFSSNYYFNGYYIPSTLEEVVITDATGISAYAFYGCTMVTKMSINDGITIIGQYAFYNCVNLLQINGEVDGSYNIPNGVKTIGTFAFYNCVNIEEISLDATVMSIGENSFENCAGITLLKYGGMTEDNWNAISIGAGNDFLTSASRTYYKGTMKLTLNLNGFSWATSGYTIAVVFNGSNGNQWIEMVLVDGIYVCDIPDGYEDSEFCFVRVQGTVLSDEYIKHQTNTFSTVMNTNYKLTSWSTAEKY